MPTAKDTLEWIRDVALILFGYTGFLHQIYIWTNQNITTTIIFAIILAIILFLAGFLPNLIKDKGEDNK